MKLLEYQAQKLFAQYGLPVMRNCVIEKLEGIEEAVAAAGLSYPLVVKAQVQIGGRGKAGGIQFAENAKELREHCERLLFSDLRGLRVNHLMLVEKAAVGTEWYVSIMLDRLSKKPLIIFSAEGGMEIEETAKKTPEKVIKLAVDPMMGLQDFHVRQMLSRAKLSQDYFGKLYKLMQSLYAAFIGHDCMLCEINPLVVDAEGNLIALDGKVDIDDSALYRLPDIAAYQDGMAEEALVKEAADHNFLYIPIEEGGSIAVTSNGSGMLMSCIDLISKEGMKVGAALDLGGGATAERIREAMRILFSTPGIKAVLINIFGGITRCDEVAKGVKLMMESGDVSDKIVVIRMEGTNKEIGQEIIAGIDGEIVSVPGLRESVAALNERRARL